jgi:hypothetical protein
MKTTTIYVLQTAQMKKRKKHMQKMGQKTFESLKREDKPLNGVAPTSTYTFFIYSSSV